MITRRSFFQRILAAAAGTVLAKWPLVGPKVEPEEKVGDWPHVACTVYVATGKNVVFMDRLFVNQEARLVFAINQWDQHRSA